MQRPPWNAYFMEIATLAASRSSCLRRKVGCVIVKDKRILATGYNGAAKGLKSCLDKDSCIRQELDIPSGQRHELCHASHAEMNAICQAAVTGISIEGADLFCTHQPCSLCTKLLINCGIRNIYIRESYPDELTKELLTEAEIKLIHVGTSKDTCRFDNCPTTPEIEEFYRTFANQ